MHPSTIDEHDVDSAATGGSDKPAYVRSVFEQIAPRYDLLNHLLSFNVDRRWRRRALRELRWSDRPAGVYLDLCAGTMDVSAQLTRETGFHGYIVAADFAVPMLQAGEGKVQRRKVAPIAADALALPFVDGSLDGAVVAFGIRNVASLSAALREVHRVLRPGMRLVILEFTTPPSRLVRAAYHLYFHRVLPAIGGMISGHATAYRYLPKSVAHFPDEPTLAGLMSEAGFDEVSWRRLTFGVAAIHVGRKSSAPSWSAAC